MTTHFPKVKITGGPHGKNTSFEIDGKQVEKVHRVELALDVNDVVRMVTVYQYVEAEIDLEIDVEGKVTGEHIARITIPDFEEVVNPSTLEKMRVRVRPKTEYEGRGRTQRLALMAAMEQMPKDLE